MESSSGTLAPPGRVSLAAGSVTTVIAALLGLLLAATLYLAPPAASMPTVVVGGIAALGVLALALVRYDLAAGLGFLLLGVLTSEPAPPDLVFAIVICVALTTGRVWLNRVPVVVVGLLFAFLALNVLSMLEAIDPGRAGLYFVITLFLVVFAIWLCGFVDSAERARLVLVTYVAGATIAAVAGSLALLFPFPGSETLLYEGCCRAKGLFEDPNVYGPFLVPAALFVLQETVEPRLLRIGTPAKALLFAILMLGVLFSFSRGAWVNAVVAVGVLLLVLAMRRGGGRRGIAVIAIVAVAGGGLAAAVTLGGSSDFLRERAALQSYDSDRFDAQRAGFESARQYPVGIGPGQFEVVSPVATHSTYVRVLAEQGVLGLAVWLGVALVTLLLAIRNALAGVSTYGIGSAALLGAWCGLLVSSFAVDTLHWRHLWVIAALIWAGALLGPGRAAGDG